MRKRDKGTPATALETRWNTTSRLTLATSASQTLEKFPTLFATFTTTHHDVTVRTTTLLNGQPRRISATATAKYLPVFASSRQSGTPEREVSCQIVAQLGSTVGVEGHDCWCCGSCTVCFTPITRRGPHPSVAGEFGNATLNAAPEAAMLGSTRMHSAAL